MTVSVDGANDPSSTGTWVRIDATVVGGVPKSTPRLTGLWPNYPGSYTYTGSKGASVTLKFWGTGLQWTALTGPNEGRAKVTIDGATVATKDLYAPGYGPTTYTFAGLADTCHTVVISALGTKDRLKRRDRGSRGSHGAVMRAIMSKASEEEETRRSQASVEHRAYRFVRRRNGCQK